MRYGIMRSIVYAEVDLRAFIYTIGGRPFNEECSSALRGFDRLGIEVVLFESNDTLSLAGRKDIVVGDTPSCGYALARQGVCMPVVDFPCDNQAFFGGKVTERQVGSILPIELPVFVKPAYDRGLPGSFVQSMEDLASYMSKGETYPLYVSRTVSIVSEWRVFVRYRNVLGAVHFLGDKSIQPDWVVAKHAIDRLNFGQPHGYALDLAVTGDGRTLLVKGNDGFALCSYGLDDVAYALLLSARWAQLMGILDELHGIESPDPTGPIAEAMRGQTWTDCLYGKSGVSIPAKEQDLPCWVWGVAANVRDYPAGLNPKEGRNKRRGTKHFAPGSLVWVLEDGWPSYGRMAVVGKKRGTHRYIRKVMDIGQLENFRAKRVYSPTVISWMRGARADIRNYGDCGKYSLSGQRFFGTYLSRDEAEGWASIWNKRGADGR